MPYLYSSRIARSLILFYLVWLALHLISSISRMDAVLDYTDWGLSDMLINYQAGFVRRGLLGDILYRIYQIVPFDVGHAVLAIIIVSAVLCFTLMYRAARQMSYSPVLLFSGFTLQFMALAEVSGIRRDYLTLLLTFASFWFYRRWLRSQACSFFWLLLCQCTIIISVLLHEGSWFYIIPFLLMHFLCWSHVRGRFVWLQSILRSLAFGAPSVLLMLFIYFHKGSTSIAHQIWTSWQPLFIQYPRVSADLPSIGYSVDYLSSSMPDHIISGIHSNWGLTYFGWLPMFPLTLALFPVIVYLITHANDSQFRLGYPLDDTDRPLLTSILLIQLAALSPFFLFMSCDYGRLFCYWIVSTLFAFWVFRQDKDCVPIFVQKISDRIQQRIAAVPFLNTPLGYVLVLVLTPCNMVGGAALGAIPLYRMIMETPTLFMSIFR